MTHKIKTAKIAMNCPFTKENEIVYIRYIGDDKLPVLVESNGCEKNYHACKACENCLAESVKKFNASRNQ